MAEVDKALIKTLAEANGISIPEDRLEVVLKQYQTYLGLLNQLESFPLAQEAEPSLTFILPAEETRDRRG
jgi:Asp-tRNA(Asn)/Glu-tRNA(Gln) amidotransferase C subunit